ncbi:hypothetical protein BS47DRAFT_1358800 [Hydnum rufescens UP504]|uniref:Uncharacterized protein n=1 Tax=Hydnum rufescens UP504 TaxID=1448309 RepID=A0A9P6B6A1_9AGAM|nr:hypothetical protein BS47DRAFT_1358800 [Hydnum rufescens UP504]
MKPSNTKPSDMQPSNTKPSDMKPSNAKPSDMQPSNTKPSDMKPSDMKPSNAKPSNTKPNKTTPSQLSLNENMRGGDTPPKWPSEPHTHCGGPGYPPTTESPHVMQIGMPEQVKLSNLNVRTPKPMSTPPTQPHPYETMNQEGRRIGPHTCHGSGCVALSGTYTQPDECVWHYQGLIPNLTNVQTMLRTKCGSTQSPISPDPQFYTMMKQICATHPLKQVCGNIRDLYPTQQMQ